LEAVKKVAKVAKTCSNDKQFFFKENRVKLVWIPVWICRDPISLILGTRFSLILGTQFEIAETRIGSLKRLKKTLMISLKNPLLVWDWTLVWFMRMSVRR